jgi:uncharacterized membrane protein
MPWKSTLLALLALAGSSLSCADHGHAEAVPEHEREELLRKWDQEVFHPLVLYMSLILIIPVLLHRNLQLRAPETRQVPSRARRAL